MLRSILLKFILCAGLLLAPSFVMAKTLQYNDLTWQIEPATASMVMKISVRNDLNLTALSKSALLGMPDQTTVMLLDVKTAEEINAIASQINKPASDAKLVIDGKVATEFDPGTLGQGLDVLGLRLKLHSGEDTIILPVITSAPSNKLSDTNNLGIIELVAIGESDFKGSPKNRVHNIKVGAAKFNGLIIDSGEEFSFNKYLGEVDGEHGFLPELVIKKTGVTPEFGGGLCQVSSTTFRAAMNAGLPITARRNHSFAVQYYAPQGTDATIYPGVVDLKFNNDYNSPILVRTRIEGQKLFFDFYGTKDNRSVTFDGPVQYDKKNDGSMKATWKRIVTLNGQTSEQTFNSVYQPPALFHKEEQTATPNPQTQPTVNNQPITAGANTNAN